jgi:hypothetical protein
VCLLIFTLLFMLGVDNPHKQLDKPEILEDNVLPPSDTHTAQDRGPCTAVAVLLQYFLLGTFTWNTLYATNVFLMIRSSLATSPSHFTAYTMAIGWGRTAWRNIKYLVVSADIRPGLLELKLMLGDIFRL